MASITAYTVASASYSKSLQSAIYDKKLEDEVNALIAKGWQPFGSITSVDGEDGVIFFQPMVQYAD